MNLNTNIKGAAKSNLLSFDNIPTSPVILNDNFSSESQNLIVERYNKHGFSIVQLNSYPPEPETILELGKLFDLGEPFVPPLYTKGGYKGDAISKITTQMCSDHPTFQSNEGVKLHCDGTLQKIGYVKTTVMLCKSPGAEGGESTLFNATGAYAELIEADYEAAIAMATPGSLVRQANMNGCSDKNIGPVFSVENGQLICNYSVTKTDKFVATPEINSQDLKRGVDFMKKSAKPGSPYFYEVRLESNQAILCANTKIAHGRNPYRNSEKERRCLFRGLFLKNPQPRTKTVRNEGKKISKGIF